MSQSTHSRGAASRSRRFSDLSLITKRNIGLGILVSGLLLVSIINIFANIRTQQLASSALTRQLHLADLTANTNNSWLDIQNRVFEFYNTWEISGFEDYGGFSLAKRQHIAPMQLQLDQIRDSIARMRRLEQRSDMQAILEKILGNTNAYEATVLAMSAQMEALGYRDSGELGHLQNAMANLSSLIEKTDLDSIKLALGQIERYKNDFFLRNDLASVRSTRAAIDDINEQLSTAATNQLITQEKIQINTGLEYYYDHFLAAASQHRKLQNSRSNLTGQTELAGVLISQLFERHQVDFGASIDQLERQQAATTLVTFVVALAALFGVPFIAYTVTSNVIKPVRALGDAAQRLGSGELTVRAPVHSSDEIGLTATAFNSMADQLQELVGDLENRVSERTHALELSTLDLKERSTQLEQAHQQQMEINRQLEQAVGQSQRRADLLQASAEVSRVIAQIRDLDRLLQRVTQLISLHFGFYHAGVFLIDEAGRYAVLHAANSTGGRRLLDRQHKLAVGSQGIVGFVTSTGQPRIALDVGADAAFFDNPDLPDTRSEMALPLRIGDETIGALDVQSVEEAAFVQDDVSVLTALADQIAIAIQNARLFRQSQAALEDAERAHRRYIRDQWIDLLQERPNLAYEYTLSGVPAKDHIPSMAAERAWREGTLVIAHDHSHKPPSIDGNVAVPDGAVLAVPIKVRGETIGVLDIQEIDAERTWTEEDVTLIQSVADQLGQTLEGVRLFEQTQSSLAETRTLFQTSRSLAAAQQIDDIWQAVIEAARQRAADVCGLFLLNAEPQATQYSFTLEASSDQTHPPRLPLGARLEFDNPVSFDRSRPDQPLLVTDVKTTSDLEHSTRQLIQESGFSSALFQPIAVRDRWFGLLAILLQSRHVFTQSEIDFYRTLADQAALAVEGQRLLAETQHRAEREQLIRQISDKVRSTSDLDKILQTTVEELGKALRVPRVFVKLGTEQELLMDRRPRSQLQVDTDTGIEPDPEPF